MDILDNNQEQALSEQLQAALSAGRTVQICGAGSKAFYGLPISADETLSTLSHSGVINYEPTELVITVRAGTRLAEVEALLDASGQQFPFEPPHFAPESTIGGLVASGLSGPARPYAAAVRDAVLGVTMMNGKGELLKFGGQVMKNVAGYDLSRLMTGAMGTLGLILDVSLKVVPKPVATTTVRLSLDQATALQKMREWAALPITINATAWHNGDLFLRLSGNGDAVKDSREKVAGDEIPEAAAFWASIRDQQHTFFRSGDLPLWRLAVAPGTAVLDLPGEQLIEWSGGLRWLRSDSPASTIRQAAQRAGGHATLFRFDRDALAGDGNVFAPLSTMQHKIHRNLKSAFDPQGLINPGRLYAGL